jgi:hypothetical protein
MSRPGASAREQLADLRGRELAHAEAGSLDALIELWIGRIRADAWARVALFAGASALSGAVSIVTAPKERRLRRAAYVGASYLAILGALYVRAAWRHAPMIPSFEWRTLTAASRLEYRLDDATRMLHVRELGTHARPDLTGDVPRFLGATSWGDGNAEKGWPLRTGGAPEGVARMWSTFGDMIEAAASSAGVDRQLVMVQAMCEAARSSSHPSGYNPRSSRTEPGYPDRSGENDIGDTERDARDWASNGGTHSSHGLAQALIGTAARLVPELRKMDPRSHRGWLYDPANSWRTIALYIAQLSEHDRTDPIRARCAYNAGAVYKSTGSAWGAVMWSPAVVWALVAYWNDAAAYFAATASQSSRAKLAAPAPASFAEASTPAIEPAEQSTAAEPAEASPAAPAIVPDGALLPIVAQALRAIAEDEPPTLAPLSKSLHDEIAAALVEEPQR